MQQRKTKTPNFSPWKIVLIIICLYLSVLNVNKHVSRYFDVESGVVVDDDDDDEIMTNNVERVEKIENGYWESIYADDDPIKSNDTINEIDVIVDDDDDQYYKNDEDDDEKKEDENEINITMSPGDSSSGSSAFDQDDDAGDEKKKYDDGTTGEEQENNDDENYLEEATDNKRQQNGSSLSYHSSDSSNTKEDGNESKDFHPGPLKFFILDPPNITSDLLQNEKSSSYYEQALNEESGEVWLHRGFVSLNYEQGHTQDPDEADVFLIAGYAHLHAYGVYSEPINGSVYETLIVDPSKPHLLLMPSWNPKRARYAGIPSIVATLQSLNVNLWSVGFERNPHWQSLPPSRIVPIPYVVRLDPEEQQKTNMITKRDNFVFYAGSPRIMAVKWGGCDRRTMLEPLKNETNMFVRVLNGGGARITQDAYIKFMQESEYCLIMCGDTPTSRSLTSAMISECIPIRVGSRLRGLCEPPCVNGWGWTVSGADYPQLPYSNNIEWDEFPEVNEVHFTENGKETLNELFRDNDQDKKAKMRDIMKKVREGWIYGWGDPVKTADFGGAYSFILDSFAAALHQENITLSIG